jgi:hypothetical protein
MKYNLFLDDRRTPTSDPRVLKKNSVYQTLEWVVVRSYDEFTQHITKFGLPSVVSFDHDLSDEHVKYYFEHGGHENPPTYEEQEYITFKEKTGKQCADWLVQYCIDNQLRLPLYYVHSANGPGSENIKSSIETAKKYLGL